MAEKVKFKTGTLTSMPSDLEAGTIAVARDTGDMYICVPDLENPTSNTKYKHHINPQTNYNQTDTTNWIILLGEKLFQAGFQKQIQKQKELFQQQKLLLVLSIVN